MGHYKEQTAKLSIKKANEPEFLYVPLSQHIGAPAKALVKPGDKVLVGQKIGSTDAFVTAHIHAPVSGEVVEIIKIKNALGFLVEAIKIKNDNQNSIDPQVVPYKSLEDMTAEEIVEAVRNAGLVGMGGATFPTHVKITPPKEKKVDTVILNAAECEPYLTADHRLLLENAADVLMGLKAFAKAVDAKKVYIGIEDNKMDAVKALEQAGAKSFCKIKVLPSIYPMGAEKVLVKKVTGKKVANKGIPLDVGVVVVNVGTAYQLARTLLTGMPLIERVVTVSGNFLNPGNYLTKIGTLYKDLVAMPGDEAKEYRTISGGPMMGFTVDNLEIPVAKGTSGILLIPAVNRIETNCLRCGKCVDGCPLGLHPYQDKGLDECMECGRCAYECPANRFLVQNARLYKQNIKKVAK